MTIGGMGYEDMHVVECNEHVPKKYGDVARQKSK